MKPLKIGLIAGSLNGEHVRGMGKYLLEMSACTQPADELSWVFFGDNASQPMRLPQGVDSEADVFELKGHRFHFWEQLGIPLRQRRHKVDLLHYAENTVAWWQPVPSVVTVHDTIPWESGEPSFYWDRLLPAALHRCAHVITISESSRQDILKHWPRLEPKLTVIPHGIDAAYFGDAEPKAPPLLQDLQGKPYLLYLGGPMARKRFDWALEVLARTPLPDLQMIAIGFGGKAREQATLSVPESVRGRVHLAPFVDDDELRALYRKAQAVLYPTLYEGFGFPAVESQASGVPVLMSALGSLKELIGPLAVVLSAQDIEAWVAAVLDACSRAPAQREALALKARTWAERFAWQQSYEQHLGIYRRVCAAHP